MRPSTGRCPRSAGWAPTAAIAPPVPDEIGRAGLSHFARTAVISRPCVVDDEIGRGRIERRAADVNHQVIGRVLRRLLVVEDVARAERADVARDEPRVEADERLCVGELRVRRRGSRRP